MRSLITIAIFLSAGILSAFVFGQNMDGPPITAEMTVNPDQHRAWEQGNYKYSARPKDMWEIGVHGGHFLIDGDVDPLVPPGYGLGVHLRRSWTYVFSTRIDIFYGQTKGIDPQPTDGFVAQKDIEGYPGDKLLHRSFRTRYFSMGIQGIVNFGNILFHKPRNRWSWYLFVGAGVNHNETHIDAYDGDGNTCDYGVSISSLSVDVADHRKERVQIVKGSTMASMKQRPGLNRVNITSMMR